MNKIKLYENIHVLFWLIKDLSWVMVWKPLGMIMIIPTIGFALWFCFKYIHESEFFVHFATLFWILANALWMLLEFFQKEEYKFISGILFMCGLISIFYYIIKEFVFSKNSS